MSEDKWSHIRKFLGESGEDILIYHYIQCVICNVINRKNRCYTSCYTRLDAVQKPPFPGASECKYGVRTPDRALTITVFTDIGAVGTVIFLCAGKPWFTRVSRLFDIVLQYQSISELQKLVEQIDHRQRFLCVIQRKRQIKQCIEK